MTASFMSEEHIAQSWYVIDRAARFSPGDVKTYDVLRRRLVVFCDEQGHIQVLDARCPHLGADLGQGKVVNGRLRCAMHHWCFDRTGQCTRAPGLQPPPTRAVRRYPTIVKWGLVWVFNGPTPLFELPNPMSKASWHAIHLPPQTIACHPHLVIGNGLDVDHIQGLHDMTLLDRPTISQPSDHQVKVSLRAQPRSPLLQRLSGSDARPIDSTFCATGGSIAWASVQGPVSFHALFTGRLSSCGKQCQTQTVVFLKRRDPRTLWRAGVILHSLLGDDRDALEGMMFRPEFTERDEALLHYMNMINRLPVA